MRFLVDISDDRLLNSDTNPNRTSEFNEWLIDQGLLYGKDYAFLLNMGGLQLFVSTIEISNLIKLTWG